MHLLARDTFHRDDIAASHERERDKATVDRAVTTFAARIAVDDRDRAGAAIAFRAALLRSGQAGAAEPFEQGEVRRNRIDAGCPAVQSKPDCTAHARRLT